MSTWRSLAPIALALAWAGCDATSAQGARTPAAVAPSTPDRPTLPALPASAPAAAPPIAPRLPAASRRQLGGGTDVVVVEDGDAPRVALRLSVPAGTSSETERAGAAIVAAEALALGLEEEAAALGTRIEVHVGPDDVTFGIDVLPESLGPAFDLLVKLARGPAPQAPLVARATRRAALDARRLAAEDDEHAAAYVIVRDAYDLPTARHPYGTASATAGEIADVKIADVRLVTTPRYFAGATALIVVGDVHASDVMALAEKAFPHGEKRSLPRIDLTEPFARDHDRVTLVDRPGASGAHVFVGLPGPGPDDAAAVAGVELATEIVADRLGAGAGARLYTFDAGPQIARLDLRTSPQRAAAEVERVQAEVARIASEAPSGDELATAKRRVLGRAARQLATNDGVADALAAHGVPARRLAALESATPELVSLSAQVLARAKAHVVVVADANVAAQGLTTIAEVKVIDPLADYARRRSVQAKR